MLVGMRPRLVAVFMPVMRVGTTRVAMLVLMLVFVVAAHAASPPFLQSLQYILNQGPFPVNYGL
jgi:hypothetical protein